MFFDIYDDDRIGWRVFSREDWISTTCCSIEARPLRGGAAVFSPRAFGRQSTTTRARVRSSAKLECSAGPVCFDSLGVSEGPATVALRPVGEVAARSEPSLLRLLDTEKSGQLSRARDRLSSFCKKLRRTISECLESKYSRLSLWIC